MPSFYYLSINKLFITEKFNFQMSTCFEISTTISLDLGFSWFELFNLKPLEPFVHWMQKAPCLPCQICKPRRWDTDRQLHPHTLGCAGSSRRPSPTGRARTAASVCAASDGTAPRRGHSNNSVLLASPSAQTTVWTAEDIGLPMRPRVSWRRQRRRACITIQRGQVQWEKVPDVTLRNRTWMALLCFYIDGSQAKRRHQREWRVFYRSQSTPRALHLHNSKLSQERVSKHQATYLDIKEVSKYNSEKWNNSD
jgi:hypothetical protein